MIPCLGERVATMHKQAYNQLMNAVAQAINTCPFVEIDSRPTIKFSIQMFIAPDVWAHVKDLFEAKDWFLNKKSEAHDIHEIYVTHKRVN